MEQGKRPRVEQQLDDVEERETDEDFATAKNGEEKRREQGNTVQ